MKLRRDKDDVIGITNGADEERVSRETEEGYDRLGPTGRLGKRGKSWGKVRKGALGARIHFGNRHYWRQSTSSRP